MSYSRKQYLSEQREKTPCKFDEGISYYEFEQIAKKVAKQFPRIKVVTAVGANIYCTVESQTRYSDWFFRVNFNNWGHINGTYWYFTENDDSDMHYQYGYKVSAEVNKILANKGISFPDYDGIISEDDEAGTSAALSYVVEESFWEKLFTKRRQIEFECSADSLVGEHIYYVVALLKRWGFKNIKTCCIKDVGNESKNYIYEVDHISIKDAVYVRKGSVFPSNAAITIYYHDKQEITIKHSVNYYKRKNYVSVGDEFVDMGFSKIYERKIEDLVTGWITKDGSVENVLVKIGNKEIQMEKGQQYEFDTPIIITYHTFKYI